MRHFDMIIANPPYSCGNQIVRAILDGIDFDEFINLMPLSCYKSNNLSFHVTYLKLADPHTFQGASITDNLSICCISKKAGEMAYNDLELKTYDQQYLDFFKLNNELAVTYTLLPNMSALYDINKNPFGFSTETDFMITTRTAQDGVHKTAAHDIEWNIEKKENFTLAYMIRLSPEAHKNLCTFWYQNPLMNALIKGLRKKSGNVYQAIPNIDWTKDRPYETCTLDDIMNWLREDNENVSA